MKSKLTISVLRASSDGVLKLLINKKVYEWQEVSYQFMQEFADELNQKHNRGRLLERLEAAYGEGQLKEGVKRRTRKAISRGIF